MTNNNQPTQMFSTEELAQLARQQPGSIRSAVCRQGHWMGLKPVKLPNRRLLWSAPDVQRVLTGSAS